MVSRSFRAIQMKYKIMCLESIATLRIRPMVIILCSISNVWTTSRQVGSRKTSLPMHLLLIRKRTPGRTTSSSITSLILYTQRVKTVIVLLQYRTLKTFMVMPCKRYLTVIIVPTKYSSPQPPIICSSINRTSMRQWLTPSPRKPKPILASACGISECPTPTSI